MTAVALTLRPYQLDALSRTEAAEARGVRRQLGQAATGLGKTVMFCSLAQRRGGRAVILAHRDELVQQAAAKVREVWPGVDVGIVKAGADEVDAHVVVASVQTLARKARMDRLVASQGGDGSLLRRRAPFELVVVDEAHHAAAASYVGILDALRAGRDPGPLLLGVTATPDRGDGKGLDDLFDEIVWSYDILWGIREGYLSDLRGLRISLDSLDLSKVKVTGGDYQAGASGRALEDAGAPQAVVRAWLEHAADRRTLVFTPTVSLAQEVAAEFAFAGITAGMVSGETPTEERRRILADYSAGRITVLANCAVLTEGYDEPRTDCIVVARPTKSRALYTQMIGRGTRRHPDKADCLVLDVVGASAVHSLVTIPSLFGLPEPFEGKAGESVIGAVEDFQREEVRLGRLRAEEADLFHKARAEGIAWVAVHQPGERQRYVRPLGRDASGALLPTVHLARMVESSSDVADPWIAGLVMADGTKRTLVADVSMELAQGVAEDYCRKHGSTHLVAADAAWRKRRPSDRALAAAKKWRLNIDPSWSAGELSEALDAHIARKRGHAS